jgi:hypothetical protein
MNEINISQDLVDGSTLLSAPGASLELRKIGKAIFALCHPQDQSIVLGFLSSSLIHFLEHSNTAEMLDASLSLSRTMAGFPTERSLILRLKLSNGSLIILNNADELYVAEPYIACENSGSVYSPNRKWGLTEPLFINKMLLTERMISCLEDMGVEHLPHLLFTLWKDFEMHVKCSKPCRTRITIAGEFMAYSVTPFADGLFVFDYV